jgi:hypothetical protein
MQDFKQFDYVIDFDGIIKAIENGQQISVIINGEFYDFESKKDSRKDSDDKKVI